MTKVQGEKKQRRKKFKAVVERGKRKTAVARATVRQGTGRITVNNLELEAISSPTIKQVILEPLNFADRSNFDIEVSVRGGGVAGQAQAVRTAIARGIVALTQDAELKGKLMEYDRSLLVEDPRRVEPKKFKGPKARARFTKSYR